MIDTSKIQNGHLLTDIFGYFPTFHDAEVHQINLIRGDVHSFSPTLVAVIHAWEMTPEVDEKNRYILRNHILVELRFSKISNLEILDFNYQNVLGELIVTETSEPLSEKTEFEVSFEGIFGVRASFRCGAISIESVSPYEREAR